jgi:eukaryotic-like serine/threonine-protein kinase
MDVACQVADALRRLHALTIIHRDVSVCNIMRSRSGIMKIADFGISRMCDNTLHITNGTSIQGNVPYMAPEQSDPTAHTTDRSDIWAFAATMLEAWTGQMPYGKLNQWQVMRQHIAGLAPALDVSARPLPPALRNVLAQCFRVAQAERPSAAALYRQLCNIKAEVLREGVRARTACTSLPSFVQVAEPSVAAAKLSYARWQSSCCEHQSSAGPCKST